MGGNDDATRAYSTQLVSDAQSGYHADGYSVVIKPAQLEDSIATFRKGLDGQNHSQLVQTMLSALVDAQDFGTLPNAVSAFSELKSFVMTHADAMGQMGVSFAEFVARVQAAADLGYQADPETKMQAARAARMRME